MCRRNAACVSRPPRATRPRVVCGPTLLGPPVSYVGWIVRWGRKNRGSLRHVPSVWGRGEGGNREEDTGPGDACRARTFAGIRVRPAGRSGAEAWGQQDECLTARVELGPTSEASGLSKHLLAGQGLVYFPKFFKISRHIESYGTCIKH